MIFFSVKISIKVFHKLMLLRLVAIARYAQLLKISLDYLCNISKKEKKKKKRGMRLIFCKQINVKSFLQVVSVNFRGYVQLCSKCKNFLFFLILNLKFFISRNVKESINKSNYLARQTI